MEEFDQENEDESLEIDLPLKRPLYETTGSMVKKKMKFKQPTVEELNELNETQTLFNNNLFRLQIQELLLAAKIKKKHKERLASWMDEFQVFLNTLPIHDAINISKFSKKALDRPSRDQRFIQNITHHCKNNLNCDQDIPVTFVRPDSIGTFGLYKIDSLPGPILTMNLLLTIPKKCFHAKDFLNNRYSVKKFYYLMYIAEHLKSKNICSSIKCSYYNENVMLPYLIVVPSSSDKITVNIFVIPEQNYFKGNRFLPDVNNVRTPIFEADLPIGDMESLAANPTSLYNASLGFDCSLAENNEFIEDSFSNLTNVQEGLKLIIVWMNQRKFNEGLGSFANELVVYIVMYLILKRKIDKHMSSYQVFRNFLNFMKTTDLTQTPISVCENISEEVLEKFKDAFDVVIVDRTGYYNVASFLDVNVYLKMRYECELAFTNLDQDTSNSFSNLFLVKVPVHLQYDGIIDIISEDNFQSLLKNVSTSEKAKYLGNHMLLVIKILHGYLKTGLNERVLNIVPLVPSHTKWDYGVRHKVTNHRLMFGIKLNPDAAFSIMERGPCLNEPGENEFRNFWGALSSNRRFRDASTRVAVVFDVKTIKDQRDILKRIVKFVISEKLNLEYKFYYNEFEEVVVNEKIESWYPIGTNEETTVKIIKSSDELGQLIRNLNLQLKVTGIGGISDAFCYTNVFPPVPTTYRSGKLVTSVQERNIILKEEKLHAAPKYIEPVECVIQLEHSSKWPGELKALQSMKTLLYLQISKLLQEQHIVSSVKSNHLDILYEGIVFRYTFFLNKEIVLMKRSVKPNGSLAYTNTEESLALEKKFNIMPKIIGALKGIQSQYPSYGVSTCLAKRWIRAQLIDDYLFPDIVINLLNAHQFLNSSLYAQAMSPQVAFLRFLKFIVEVPWDLEPVVLNFNKELTSEHISNVDSQVRTNRNNFPALFILTPYDNGDSIFTKNSPSKEVLIRLKVLATECLNVVENIIMEKSLYSIKELFIPNKNGFDLILNLKSLTNPRRHQQIMKNESDGKVQFKEPIKEENTHLPVINFDPVQMYLKELRVTYGAFCIFFHDTYGGNYIGVLWHPKKLEPKDVKVSYMLGRKIENDQLVLDKEEIIRGFKILGMDILKSVDLNG